MVKYILRHRLYNIAMKVSRLSNNMQMWGSQYTTNKNYQSVKAMAWYIFENSRQRNYVLTYLTWVSDNSTNINKMEGSY